MLDIIKNSLWLDGMRSGESGDSCNFKLLDHNLIKGEVKAMEWQRGKISNLQLLLSQCLASTEDK